MKRTAVILVSTEVTRRRALRLLFTPEGFEVLECEDRARVAELARMQGAAIVFVSSGLAQMREDVRAAAEIRRLDRHCPLILVVGESSEELAVAAMRSGINDLFHDPETLAQLPAALARLMGAESIAAGEMTSEAPAHPIIGVSRPIRELRTYLAKVAASDSNVLITGETGTGKELAAEILHHSSPRRHKKLISVNCAAIPDTLVESELFGFERGAFTGAHAAREGKFRSADGGTLFLDEIGDMDLQAQAKLLRAIESKEVYSLGAKAGLKLNVRVVAATNQDPEQLMRENRFRKDLYFRLNVARIHLAPLRERKEDIGVLVDHSIQDLNRRFGYKVKGCSDEALALLLRYDWPGNVRELKNLLEATFIELNSQEIAPGDFPSLFHRRAQAPQEPRIDERERMLTALGASNWNISKAAQTLKWSRMTMYRKIAKYQIARV
jgi:DNA-binding NtrC family response regulator